jgi:hypothetical protein
MDFGAASTRHGTPRAAFAWLPASISLSGMARDAKIPGCPNFVPDNGEVASLFTEAKLGQRFRVIVRARPNAAMQNIPHRHESVAAKETEA